jgi:hypothetical protein
LFYFVHHFGKGNVLEEEDEGEGEKGVV